MSPPEFSVIICTYNRPTLLVRAIESVLAQTFSDFEVIIVDDHGEEPARGLVENFRDPRLRYLRQPENRGVACSTNLGLGASRGIFVSILNDDDCYRPDFLARMSEHLRATNSVFAWSGVEDAFEDRAEDFARVFKLTHHQDPWAVEELVTRVGLGFGFTIRRESLALLGGLDEKLRSSEDTELFLRLVGQPWDWQSIPDCLVKVFRQTERLTKPSSRRAQDLSYVMHKHADFFATHPALLNHFRLVLGSIYVELGERLEGRRLLLALLRVSPLQLRVWALLMANEVGLGARLLDGYRKARAWVSRSALTRLMGAVDRARSAGGRAPTS